VFHPYWDLLQARQQMEVEKEQPVTAQAEIDPDMQQASLEVMWKHEGPEAEDALAEVEAFCVASPSSELCEAGTEDVPDCTGEPPAASSSARCWASCPLLRPAIADPRQSRYSVGYRWDDSVFGDEVLSASVGDTFSIYRSGDPCECGNVLELALSAAARGLWDLRGSSTQLVTHEYQVDVPLALHHGAWTTRARYSYLTAHVGDEYIWNNPPQPRSNLNHHQADLYLFYDVSESLRYYLGGAYIFTGSSTSDLQPFLLEAGGEAIMYTDCGDSCSFVPFVAFHIRCAEDNDWDLDGHYMAGFQSLAECRGRCLRAYVEYHHGFAHEALYPKRRSSYIGVGVHYGL
jgi:hypothetical protein